MPRPRFIRLYHRNGRLRLEQPTSQGRVHGRVRTWHRDGQLATDLRFTKGLLDGECRQWNRAGLLLGSFSMRLGTGVVLQWHDNGRLQSETATKAGQLHGRMRVWLSDGTLVTERFYRNNEELSFEAYRAARHLDLPRYRQSTPRTVHPPGRPLDLRKHRLLVRSYTATPEVRELRDWVSNHGKGKVHLGPFKSPRALIRFADSLYEAGAKELQVADIYRDKSGNQFADALVIGLPEADRQRTAIRSLALQHAKKTRGTVSPAADLDEDVLLLLYL